MKAFLIALSLIATSICSQAQTYLKPKSADYIRRTAFMITTTHKEMMKLDSARKDGKFATAVAHQRMARKCFEVDDYRNAVYYSAYARRLTLIVHSTFNPLFNSKFKDTAEEMDLVRNTPTDKVLQENMIKANPGIKFNDNDYLGDIELYKIDVDDLLQP